MNLDVSYFGQTQKVERNWEWCKSPHVHFSNGNMEAHIISCHEILSIVQFLTFLNTGSAGWEQLGQAWLPESICFVPSKKKLPSHCSSIPSGFHVQSSFLGNGVRFPLSLYSCLVCKIGHSKVPLSVIISCLELEFQGVWVDTLYTKLEVFIIIVPIKMPDHMSYTLW